MTEVITNTGVFAFVPAMPDLIMFENADINKSKDKHRKEERILFSTRLVRNKVVLHFVMQPT